MNTNVPTKIELGCGEQKPSGFYGVDIIDTPATDQIMDLDDSSWDLPSNHFEIIRAIDVFEHLNNPLNFFEEIYRIGTDGARIRMRSPHRSSQNWTDPTHKRLVGFNTVAQYCTPSGKYSYYADASFEMEQTSVEFTTRPAYPWNYVIEPIVNTSWRTQAWFENSFLARLFPAHDVEFIFRISK